MTGGWLDQLGLTSSTDGLGRVNGSECSICAVNAVEKGSEHENIV